MARVGNSRQPQRHRLGSRLRRETKEGIRDRNHANHLNPLNHGSDNNCESQVLWLVRVFNSYRL